MTTTTAGRAGGIQINPEAFLCSDQGCNERLMVLTTDTENAIEGLSRAGHRFYSVSYSGRILTSAEKDKAVEFTPGYVSSVRLRDDGPWIYVDTASHIPPAMRKTLLAIVVEELENAGVRDAVLTRVPDDTQIVDVRPVDASRDPD